MAKLSTIKGMQDAREKDMFHLPNSNYIRYNGHVQVSPGTKSNVGKKERKGCTKGKIEAVMRNSSLSPSVISQTNMTVSAVTNSGGNHLQKGLQTKPTVEIDDPYTFTETESQVANYAPPSSSFKKQNVTIKLSPPAVTQPKQEPRPQLVKHNHKTSDLQSKMNKLQADFARNKVMGKRKKSDQPVMVFNTKLEPAIVPKKENTRVLISSRKNQRKTTWQRERKARHELLERIEEAKGDWEMLHQDIYPLGLEVSDSDEDSEYSQSIYEEEWWIRKKGMGDRESRVSSTRCDLRRQLSQTTKGVSTADSAPATLLRAVIQAARVFPNATALLLQSNPPPLSSAAKYINKVTKEGMFLLRGDKCDHWEGCSRQALPCTRHCAEHIMCNVDQRLFTRCTAKSVENKQCNVPVVHLARPSSAPLCHLHSSPETFNSLEAESKSGKKMNRKSRVLGVSRSGKRSQKKRKKMDEEDETNRTLVHVDAKLEMDGGEGSMDRVISPSRNSAVSVESEPALETVVTSAPPTNQLVEVDGEVSEEVLAIASLDPVELANQATRLLEEHDLTNVLNQISTDAFNDLFAEDKNGGYEPTREETEELDRALEAVDNDVRSLEERMTRSLPSLLPLVDSFFDEHPLAAFPPPPPFPTDIQPS